MLSRMPASANSRAQLGLGILHMFGYGVAQDYVKAHMWYSLAAEQLPPADNRQKAVCHRNFIEELMTPDQVAEAQRLAREWKPK